MKPIEKANDLVNKMFNCDKATPEESMAMLYPHALQCALIAVDEILKSQPYDIYTIKQCDNMNKYWQEVKNEIEYMKLKSLPK